MRLPVLFAEKPNECLKSLIGAGQITYCHVDDQSLLLILLTEFDPPLTRGYEVRLPEG